MKPHPPSVPKASSAANLVKTELFLSYLLRFGVIASLSLLIFGTTLTLIRHPDYVSQPKTLRGLTEPGAVFPRSITELVQELKAFRGRAFVVLGLLLLVLTPVMRVAASIGLFVRQRDWYFVAITAVVLLILIISFLLGKAS